ncbi:hypothetical protein ACED30_22275 [Vibrio splendidus]|uniref:hypothetical protein n=1 Tax=Vibrio splendidus TaxID=29497 RepID=UPI00352F8737
MTAHEAALIVKVTSENAACENITSDVSISSTPKLEVNQDQLIETINSVNTTLGSIPDGSFTVAIVGALCSVIAAFIFNAIYWRVVERKKKLSSEVAKFEVVLDRFEKTSTEYWTHGYSRRNSKSLLIKEMRMKAELRLLRDSRNKMAERIYKEKSRTKFKHDMQKHLSNLFDSATGGDFESTQRTEDLKRCGEIIRLCTQLRLLATGIDN